MDSVLELTNYIHIMLNLRRSLKGCPAIEAFTDSCYTSRVQPKVS